MSQYLFKPSLVKKFIVVCWITLMLFSLGSMAIRL